MSTKVSSDLEDQDAMIMWQILDRIARGAEQLAGWKFWNRWKTMLKLKLALQLLRTPDRMSNKKILMTRNLSYDYRTLLNRRDEWTNEKRAMTKISKFFKKLFCTVILLN